MPRREETKMIRRDKVVTGARRIIVNRILIDSQDAPVSEAKVVELGADYAVIEVTCSCQKKLLVRCTMAMGEERIMEQQSVEV